MKRCNISLYTFSPLLIAILFVSSPIHASLVPVVQEIGRISLSVDAEGNNNTAGGTIRVNKPSGATVRRVLLMANSHGVFEERRIADSDITIDGISVAWDRDFVNGVPGNPNFFHNVFADITSILKPRIDAAQAGLLEFNITERDTDQINGTILAVIFDDPNQETENSVILLFGGQATIGDIFIINLATLLDPATATADMGIGIGHSFQGISGTPMVNLIDVNGRRLTSSSGGEDDGNEENGGLITVGGIGDSNDNPEPLSESHGLRTDDELYNLLPFTNFGDETIEVFSFNPTDDENIFFAYFFTSVPSALLPDVTAPGDTTFVGSIDPNLPTVILTHGLQNVSDDASEQWTGTAVNQASTLINNYLLNNEIQANIVRYIWEEAFQPFGCVLGLPTDDAYITAQQNVINAGTRLAHELFRAFGTTYQMPVHFIGHSLGTAVNAYAAAALLDSIQTITLAQFTALDRPHHIRKICGLSTKEEQIYGYNSDFFSRILPISRPELDLRIDNYYSIEGAGVGEVANGPIYNHPILINPNDLDERIFFDEGFDNNHTGVNQWYRWTINPVDPFPDGTTVCDGNIFAEGRKPFGFHDSLNPCQQGWYWSLIGNGNAFPETNGDIIEDSETIPVALVQSRDFGCNIQTDSPLTTIQCFEQSSPFAVLEVDIPRGAQSLSFDYSFPNIGDGDYAAVLLDDTPIWVLMGTSAIQQGAEISSGPVSLDGSVGRRRLTVALYSVGEPNAEFQIRNLQFTVADVLNPTSAFAYITQRDANTVSIIDLTTNQIETTVPVGSQPAGVAINANSRTVYIGNRGSNTLSIIDAATNTITATIPVGPVPEGIAIHPNDGTVYISHRDNTTLGVMNSITQEVSFVDVAPPVTHGEGGRGVIIHPSGNPLYVVIRETNSVAVVDTSTLTVSNSIPVGRYAYWGTINPQGTKVYIANREDNTISVIDTLSNHVVDTIPVGHNPVNVAVHPDGTLMYVANGDSNDVMVIDTTTHTVRDVIPVGENPIGIAVHPDGTSLYTTNHENNTVSVINTSSLQVVETIPVNGTPISLGQFIGAIR